jgi:hypothetical protein
MTTTDPPMEITQSEAAAPPSTAVVPVVHAPLSIPAAMPEYLKARVAADRPGRGISEDAEDAIHPLAIILQSGSPLCNARSPDYLKGAEAGKFYFRSLPNPIRDGEQGIIVIPWACEQVWREWKPNRGGFVKTHLLRPGDAFLDPRDEFRTIRPNGNEIVRTKQVFILFEGLPFELPLVRTGIGVFQELSQHFRFQMDAERRPLPCYTRRYRFRTISRQNNQGNWFGLAFDDLGWVEAEEYDKGRQLAEALESLLKQQRELLRSNAAPATILSPAKPTGKSQPPSPPPPESREGTDGGQAPSRFYNDEIGF